MHFIILFILSALVISFQEIRVFANVSTVNQPRIVIVGAGAAGIAAASKLFENGFQNVTILEAENRIGGRVWTVPFGDYVVDLGGQWVTDKIGNPSYVLAWPHGLLHKPDNGNTLGDLFAFNSRGEKLDEATAQAIIEFLLNTMDTKIESELVNLKSLGELMEKKFDDYFKERSDILANKKIFLAALDHLAMTQDAADSWFDVAISQLTEDQSGVDAISWKDRGYSTIFDILMKRYPDPEKELPVLNNTVLNAEVALIKVLEDSGIVISTVNGNSYWADYVIVTPSLGVLKDTYKTMFNPPLPTWKSDVIEGLGFGSIGKIYLLYDKPFWTNKNNQEATTYFFAWNEEDKAAIKNNTEKEWLLGMSNAATVEYKPNILSLWMAGESTRKMEELSDETILEHSMENLRRFMGKHFNVTEPTKMIHSKWYTNPHFRGTYSFRSLKSDEMNVWAAKLGEALPNTDNPKILFAGEATNPHNFASVHGAIESGWIAAESIMKLHPNTANQSV